MASPTASGTARTTDGRRVETRNSVVVGPCEAPPPRQPGLVVVERSLLQGKEKPLLAVGGVELVDVRGGIDREGGWLMVAALQATTARLPA